MKIIALADTHNLHNFIDMPEGDMLIHAGDMTMQGRGDEIERFAAWLHAQPYKYKIVIAGNHDFLFENRPDIAKQLLGHGQDGVHYLCEQGIFLPFGDVVLNIYGAPHTPRFFDWAFNVDRGEEIKKHWDKIPDDLDILVTHGPPYGICDVARFKMERMGCEELTKAVEKKKPLIHIFGHNHAYGYKLYNGTQFYNAAICDNDYRPVNKPWEIEL